MNRRQYQHVALLFLLAVFVRLALFNYAGVWGDAGFYTYDAKMILAGDVPFLDFIGRSPLFNYSYAAVASVFGNSMAVLRAFIVTWWLLAGIPVYAMGRWMHSHRAGLVGLALSQLSPFMLAYGYWANTQSLAIFLAACAIAAVVYRRHWLMYGLAGMLLGAAFLSRRSVITIVGGLAVWTVYRMVKDRRVFSGVGQGVACATGFFATLFAGYVALSLAAGDIGLTLKFAETHAWGLISSSGRGGFPLITEMPAPQEPMNRINVGRIPVFNSICQLCGVHTIKTMLKTVLAALVLVAPLIYYVRDFVDRYYTPAFKRYGAWIVLAAATYGVLIALRNVLLVRIGGVLVLLGVGAIAFRGPPVRREILYGRHTTLMVAVLGMLAAGYLYRNRLIHAYYFADFVPFLAVLGGILYVEAWRVNANE